MQFLHRMKRTLVKSDGENPQVKAAKFLKANAFALRNRSRNSADAEAALFWEKIFEVVIETGEVPADLKLAA